MLASETTPSTQASNMLSLERVFSILLTRLTKRRLDTPIGTLPFLMFDLNISYQSAEDNEKTGVHSSVLIGYTRKELLERAIEAAAYHIDYCMPEKLGINFKYSGFDDISSLEDHLIFEGEELLANMENNCRKLCEHFKTYLKAVKEHTNEDFTESERPFVKDAFKELDGIMKNIRHRLRYYFENQIIFLNGNPMLLNRAIEYLDANSDPSLLSQSHMTNKATFDAWDNILNKVSDKLESLIISPNKQRYGKSSAAKFKISSASREHISKSLIGYYLLGKASNVFNKDFYSKHIDAIRSSEQKFDEAMLELENRLGSSYMDEKGKEREFERIKALFCLPNGDNAENWFKIFNSIYSNIIRYGYEYINRWGSGRVNDENSPYDIFIKLVKDLFEFLDKSSYMVSGINGSKVNLSERPKVTLEFKVKDPDGSSGREEVSFDFILNHPHIAGKEVRINDCSVPNGIKQCILDSSSSLLNSSTYNKIMREEFESNAVRGSYLDMIRSIFQDRNFLPSILAKACSGIANKDGLAILEDYEKFIPLYLYVELIREASSTRFRDAFDYSRPEISKPVIVLTEKDKQTVL